VGVVYRVIELDCAAFVEKYAGICEAYVVIAQRALRAREMGVTAGVGACKLGYGGGVRSDGAVDCGFDGVGSLLEGMEVGAVKMWGDGSEDGVDT